MPDEKNLLEQYGDDTIGQVTKRLAPKPARTHEAAARQDRQDVIERGAVSTWRLHPDVKPAVKRAAEIEGVTQRELVEYILVKGLQGLVSGKLTLPKKQTGSIFSIEFQSVPDEFLG